MAESKLQQMDEKAGSSTKIENFTPSSVVRMSSIGSMEPFDLAHPEGWSTYYARFELYTLANDVQGLERQKATFLTLAGAPLYDLLASLASPTQVSEMSLLEIKGILSNHFTPRPSEIAAFFKFHKRDQHPDEGFADYLAALRKISVDCNFGAALDRMLRDRLVCGLRDEALQKGLLAENDLQLAKVISRATIAEAAAKDQGEIRHPEAVRFVANRHYANHQQRRRDNNRDSVHAKPCNGCGGAHFRVQCPHKNTVCSACGVKGHIQRVCRSLTLSSSSSAATNASPKKIPRNAKKSKQFAINQVLPFSNLKKLVNVKINSQSCQFEVDSGSNYTLISSRAFERLQLSEEPSLQHSSVHLVDFQGNHIPVRGVIDVNVNYNHREIKTLPLIVVHGNQTNILGCNWFHALGISIQGVNHINQESPIERILDKFQQLFSEELGRFTGKPVSLQLDPNIQPIRFPPRKIPLSTRSLVEAELDRLCAQGVLEPCEYSDWATPIVPVPKKDGSIRICGDYKSTLNKALKPHCFKIPAISTLLSSIEGGNIFAKLDLAQAYQQLVVDKKSAQLQTIITHKGAFKVSRLQFGISSAPGIFQNFIETLLRNVSGVLPYFDDIIVMGRNETELAERLEKVFTRLASAGLRLRKDKCKFGVQEIEFLGFKIDSIGIRPSQGKLEALRGAPSPKNKKELQAFLGLLNFYHSFLPHKATLAEPLHRLLDKSVRWTWSKIHQSAFDTLKSAIISDQVLVHFDEKLPLLVVCDASPYGIGAVLSHRMPDGSEKPIAFYSKTLSKTERAYAQIDKEAVAVVSGVKKFHDYVHGRKFTLITDHKPLLGIFNPAKPTPAVISNQMLRRRIFLNAYDFDLVYRQGHKMGNADCLSRLPMTSETCSDIECDEVLMIEATETSILNAAQIATQTKANSELSMVLSWALRGWPAKIDRHDKMFPYFTRRLEISTLKGCLLWGNRVIVPPDGRQLILDALHSAHPGIVKMKALARSYVWWPNIDSDIERLVKRCIPCQTTRHESNRAPLHYWETTKSPWSRLHIDFAGPLQHKFFFIVVDSYSKWLEVFIVPSTSSQAAIKPLRSLFATHGLPDAIVSDNGTAFTSEEFQTFLRNNHIRQIRCAPFHPSSNGQAERMVQTTKDFLKKLPMKTDVELKLIRFVFSQHITPHSATGRSPAEMMFNRQLKTFFDKIHPNELSTHNNESVLTKKFGIDDPVWVRNYSIGDKWIEGAVHSQTGPVSYTVKLADGRIVKRHADQIRSRLAIPNVNNELFSEAEQNEAFPSSDQDGEPAPLELPTASSPSIESSSESRSCQSQDSGPSPSAEMTLRRSSRIRRPPDFFSAIGR